MKSYTITTTTPHLVVSPKSWLSPITIPGASFPQTDFEFQGTRVFTGTAAARPTPTPSPTPTSSDDERLTNTGTTTHGRLANHRHDYWHNQRIRTV